MAIQIKKAVRERVFLKVAIGGPTGSGKTWGAIGVAKGLAPTGKILVLDTENRSASYYAGTSDQAGAWDFDVVEIEAPFTPNKYLEGLRAAIDNGYEAVVIDSLTHEWAASGGILDQKSQKDARGGNSFTNWNDMKQIHNKFVETLLQSKIHVVATLRSKMEYVMEEDAQKKTQVKKIGLAPISSDGMEYEFGVFFDVDRNTHLAIASKDRTGLFDGRSMHLGSDIGKELKDWRDSGAELAPESPKVGTAQQQSPADTAQAPAHPTGDPLGQVRGGTREQDMARPKPSPATTGPSKPSSAAALAQTAPSNARLKPAAGIVTEQQWGLALAELTAAMIKAHWSHDSRLIAVEEWKTKGKAALPELLALLAAGLPAPETENPEWLAAMDELLKVSLGMPEQTRNKLVAGFEAEGPAALPDLLKEIETIRTAMAPKTIGAVLAQLPQTPGPEIPQDVATFVDGVDPDTDEANGGISADEYEILNTIIKAHNINRDTLRAYAAQSGKLLPCAGGRPTLARFKKVEYEKLLARLRDTKIAADRETWSARTVRIINATATTPYAPFQAAS